MAKSTLFFIFTIFVIVKGININLDKEWKRFKEYYHKNYTESEENSRRKIWEDNVKFVVTHNIEADTGVHHYVTGINKYSDLTKKEFISQMNGFRPSNDTCESADSFVEFEQQTCTNETVDWRKLGYVTPVKDQGACGSCWAFCSTGALEALHKRKTGNLVSLSEQNLMDCVGKPVDGNVAGCRGGCANHAFRYVEDNHGIDTEASYPYQAMDERCRFKRADVGATCSGYVRLPYLDETAMKIAVCTIGPITVAIKADTQSFFSYKYGIYDDPTCGTSVDHCVLIVGYGVQNGLPYWLIKNSWGTSWGDNGYVKMLRYANECGIAMYSYYPT